jgi:hypothetical protein
MVWIGGNLLGSDVVLIEVGVVCEAVGDKGVDVNIDSL